MSRRQTNQIDLKTEGGKRSVLVVPGDSVTYQFSAQQSRIGAGGGGKGMYNNIRGICIQAAINLTQPGSGAAAIPSDQIFGAIGSIGLTTPMFGTLISPTVVQNGLIAKHILELFQLGFKRNSVDRPYVPATAGTSTVNCELYIPFSQFWNPWPDDFAYWLGWLDTSQIEIFANQASDPFAQLQLNPATTPATLNSVTYTAELDMVPKGNLVIPPFVAVRRYTQAAESGSNGPNLIGVGNNGALEGCDDMSRLLAMLFAHNAGGLQGSGTADQIATLTLGWRDQIQTLNLAGIFQRFLNENKLQQYGGTSVSATAPIAQQFDYPEPYAIGPGPVTGAQPLNNANARFTPLVAPMRDQQISFLQRVKGNYSLDMTFSANQTNNFNVYTHEIKQWSMSKVSEMLSAAGIDPSVAALIPKYGNKNVKTGNVINANGSTGAPVVTGKVNAKKTFCLPRSVVINPAVTAPAGTSKAA